MTLREFIYARLRDEEEEAANRLRKVQAMGLAGTLRSRQDALYLHPNAHLTMQATQSHHKTIVWLLERRLAYAPRAARVNTMKALAHHWRHHPDFDPYWSPS